MTTTPTTPPPFDPAAPLPQMPDYRARSWEPAARRFRDLTDQERAEQASPTTTTGTQQ